MATPITTFKKIMLDLDISGTSQYSLTNDLSNNNTCFLNFNLMTNITNENVTITFEQYTSQGGSLENSETFTLNYKNNTLSRNINIITIYTLITITNNSFNGILGGFIEKLIIGDNISIDASGQTVAVRGGVDISGQRVDISGQRVDISGQRVDISGQRVDISGQRIDISGQRIDISGQRVDISGQRVDISGQSMYIMARDISSNLPTQIQSRTNQAGIVGLNVYNIYPNKLIYRMAGSASAAVTNQFLGPEANAFDGNTFNIGLNYLTNFNIYLTSVPVGITSRLVDIDYIDASGNRQQLNSLSIDITDIARLPGTIVNINNMSWTPVLANVDTRLRAIARNTTGASVYRNQLSTFLSGAGVITVPNGYVGIVSNLYYYAAVGDDVYMVVKDKYNNVKTTRFMPQPISAAGKYTNVGDINEPLYAGDSVYFLSGQSGSGQKYYNAIVTMEPL